MACFLVPMALAILFVPVQFLLHSKKDLVEKYKLTTLSLLLWGGVIMLAVEHVAHQEVVPFFPYLTAMATAEDTAIMLEEMLTIGGSMTIAIVIVWVLIVVTSKKVVRSPVQTATATAQAAAA